MLSVRPYLIGAGLLYLVGTPFALNGERHVIDDQVRAGVPGRFANLSAGRTRYDLLGPQPAEVVVLVHGFTSPSYVWGRMPMRLQDAGYRTLVYDLFGRGYSDRPAADYDPDFYEQQLRELLGKLHLDQKVHLVGLSMGGLIASDFAIRHPERVASLTMIDPAGFGSGIPIEARLLSLPLLGDYLVRAFGDSFLVSGNARGVYDQSLVPELQAKFTPQLAYRGYKRAILTSMRNMPLGDFQDHYRELGSLALPVSIFWGREDRITPFEGTEVAAQLIPQAQIHAVEHAGHLSHYEKPDEVIPVLLSFLAANPAPAQGSAEAQGVCGAAHIEAHDATHAHDHADKLDEGAARAARLKRERVRIGKEEPDESEGRQVSAADAPASDDAPVDDAPVAAKPGEERDLSGSKSAPEKKECKECDPRQQYRSPTDAERARRRSLSRPPPD